MLKNSKNIKNKNKKYGRIKTRQNRTFAPND